MMEYIASSGTPAGSFLTFTSIPNTFNSIYITGMLHVTGSTVALGFMRFNSVTTTTYNSVRGGRFEGSNVVVATAAVNDGIGFGVFPDADISAATVMGLVDVDLFAYRGDQPGNAGIWSMSSYADSDAESSDQFFTGYYTEDETTDITRIDFICQHGAWSTHSKLHLYGRTEA